MKSLYTESRTQKSLVRFSLEDRTVIKNILRREALLRAIKAEPDVEAGGSECGDVYLRLQATGKRPTKGGLYFVVDTLAETRHVLKVEYADAGWRVRGIGEMMLRPLEGFNRPQYFWFRIPDLESDDCRLASQIL